MRTLLLFLGSFLWVAITQVNAQNAFKTNKENVNQWYSVHKEQGIDFQVKHQESPYDMRFNTLMRLKNTNNYEITVSFIPKFRCGESSEYEGQHNEVKVNIYPGYTVTLLAFRPCGGVIPSEILLDSKKIRKR